MDASPASSTFIYVTNYPPIAVNDTATGTEDAFVDIPVSQNDTDTADNTNDAVTVSGATITTPSNGTAVLS